MATLSIDFTDILKATPKSTRTTKERKAKNKVVQATIGDAARLDKLPDIVTDEFLVMYNESLEDVLYPYVAAKVITIGYASNYRDTLLKTIFGSEDHLGIFHYLKEKDSDGKTDRDLVVQAEQLISKGWHIKQDGLRYWLINGDFNRVIDMTGKAPMYKEVAMISFDQSAAHLFLEDGIASKLAAIAATFGHDADSLASTGNLDVLLSKITDKKFGGYVLNYNALRRILLQPAKYSTVVDGMNMFDLHKEGYRLASAMTFPVSEKAVFSKGDIEYVMTPLEDDINLLYGANKYLLLALGARVKSDLLRGTRIVSPDVIEIKEVRNTFALMTEMYRKELADVSFADVADMVENVSGRHADAIIKSISTLAIIEGMLLGNKTFSLASLSVDSVSGNVFSRHSKEYFSTGEEALWDFTYTPGKQPSFVGKINLADHQNISAMLERVPDKVISAIAVYELNTNPYPYNLDGLKSYFSRAKKVITGTR